MPAADADAAAAPVVCNFTFARFVALAGVCGADVLWLLCVDENYENKNKIHMLHKRTENIQKNRKSTLNVIVLTKAKQADEHNQQQYE